MARERSRVSREWVSDISSLSGVGDSGAVLSLLVLTALAQTDAGAPLPSALYRASQEAAALVELELPLITTERSDLRWQRALKQPKVKAMLAARAPMDAPESVELAPFEVMRSCLRRTDHRLTVKVLVLMTGAPLQPKPLPHSTFGLGLETTPGYEALKAALIESFDWREERMRAVGADQLWRAQRKALGSDNLYLRHLAAEFLVQHGAAEVLDEVWGAPGSEARVKHEATARVAPDCKG